MIAPTKMGSACRISVLRSSRLTSCYGGRSDNDTDINWYSDNVYGTYIHIVLVVLWNRNRKGKYSQQQWTQTHGYSMYIFLHGM